MRAKAARVLIGMTTYRLPNLDHVQLGNYALN